MKSTIRISRARILAWTIAVSIAFGALGVGQPVELLLRSAGDALHSRRASGNIVVVAIDDKSLAEKGRFPWPRHTIGEIIDNLGHLGVAKIFIDGDVSSKTEPAEDASLRDAFIRSKPKVTVATRFIMDNVTGGRVDLFPDEMFRNYVDVASINYRYNFWGMVLELPYAVVNSGRAVPSLSAAMAGQQGPDDLEYPIDFSIDLKSIPVVSAVDVLKGRVARERLAGKTVVLGTASSSIGDVYLMPRHGQVSGVFFHVLGSETLKIGTPIDLGWLAPLLLAAAVLVLAAKFRPLAQIGLIAAIEIVALILCPLILHHWMAFVQVIPAIFLLMLAGGRFAWLDFRNSYRVRGTINAISGLPNLKALRDLKLDSQRALIVGRIQNFAEITSALMPDKEKELVDQIARRLTVGSSSTQLFQGDEGLFAWLAELGVADEMDDHLSALHSLFRQPVVLGTEQLDLVINFGVDRDSRRSITNRLGSALVAAEEAAAEGASWKDYDPAKLKDASWKLSLLSQLDAAIDAGDLWVAYQSKLDLASRTIIGAEALVRWTHPEKGEIFPDVFIRAAEQGNRMDKLTLYVLDQALSVTSEILATGVDFGIAVNLSARLIEDPTLVTAIVALLDQHGVDPRCLTLEITETASLGQTDANLATLKRIRDLGMGLSIDDYGTGMSTLDYLRRIPATQIKIDRCFVDAIDRGGGDLVMVNSTIQLAHSLGLEVVAEGVERQQTLDILTDLGCNTAQGYFVGRPVPAGEFKKLMIPKTNGKVATRFRL